MNNYGTNETQMLLIIHKTWRKTRIQSRNIKPIEKQHISRSQVKHEILKLS